MKVILSSGVIGFLVFVQVITTAETGQKRLETCLCYMYSMYCDNSMILRAPEELKELGLKSPDNLTLLSSNHEITSAHIYRRKITNITSETFNCLENITSLFLSDNEIGSIGTGAFSNLRNLETLFIFGNNIAYIAPDAFHNLGSLTEFVLEDHNINSLTSTFFEGMVSLQKLVLVNNSIEIVKRDAFQNLYGLKDLFLSSNKLMELDGIFKNLSSLELLNLDSNRLVQLSEDTFSDLISLRTLVLSNNPLEDLHKDVFKSLVNLVNLDLKGGKLLALREDLFKFIQNLESLTFGNSSFKATDDFMDAISTLKNLHHLEVTSCPYVTSIETRAFLNLTSLASLSINHMPELKSIDADAFYNMPNLRSISIEGNKNLKTIHGNAFRSINLDGSGNTSVTGLYLSRNGLTSLPEELFDWEKLDGLDLQRNPWNCDCNLRWMLNLGSVIKSGYKDLIKCQDPDYLADKKLLDLDESDFHCDLRAIPANEAPPVGQTAEQAKLTAGSVAAIAAVAMGILLTLFLAIFLVKNQVIQKRSASRGKKQTKYVSMVTGDPIEDDIFSLGTEMEVSREELIV